MTSVGAVTLGSAALRLPEAIDGEQLALPALGIEAAARDGAHRARAVALFVLGKAGAAEDEPGFHIGFDIFLGASWAAAR